MHHFKNKQKTNMFKYFAFEIELQKQLNIGIYLQNSIQYKHGEQCKGLLRICVPTILCFRAKLRRRKNVRLCYTPQFIRNPAFAYAKTKVMISCANTAQLINTFIWQHVFLNPKLITSNHILLLYSLGS